MIRNGTSPGRCVRVRPGTMHPVLGNVALWAGVVQRSFVVGGVEYLDIAVSAETLQAMPAAVRSACYRQKIVFSRLRIASDAVEPAPGLDPYRTQAEAAAYQPLLQLRWFMECGSQRSDPTPASSEEFGQATRRAAIIVGGFVALSVLASMLATMAESDAGCDGGTGSSGNWGRAGGGYSS